MEAEIFIYSHAPSNRGFKNNTKYHETCDEITRAGNTADSNLGEGERDTGVR